MSASLCEHNECHSSLKIKIGFQWVIIQFRLSGIPGHLSVDTCVTDTCDFFKSLTRLTRPTRLSRPTRHTGYTRITRITGAPAFTLKEGDLVLYPPVPVNFHVMDDCPLINEIKSTLFLLYLSSAFQRYRRMLDWKMKRFRGL